MRLPKETFSYRYPHPAVTTDVVVFTIRDGRLHVARRRPDGMREWMPALVAPREFELNAEAKAGKAVIRVCDHGPGIPEIEARRLFRPFSKLEKEENAAKLVIAKTRNLHVLKLSLAEMKKASDIILDQINAYEAQKSQLGNLKVVNG